MRIYLYLVCVVCLLMPTYGVMHAYKFIHTHENGHIHHEHTPCEVCESKGKTFPGIEYHEHSLCDVYGGCCHVMAPLPTTTEKVRIGKSRSVFSFPPEMTYKNVLLEKEKRPPRL